MKNMFPSCFYFNLFFRLKIVSLSGHNSKKQSHIFSFNRSHIILRSSRTFFLLIDLRISP